MKLRSTLLHIAALASATASVTIACSGGAGVVPGSEQGSPDGGAGGDGGSSGGDAGGDASVVGCGGCNCTQPAVTQGSATAEEACAIAGPVSSYPTACDTFCGALNPGTSRSGYNCTLPADYQTAYKNAQNGTKTDPDAGPDAGATCPAWAGTVAVQCGFLCLGRRTAGIDDPIPCDDAALGQVFAERAYLEAVSVHAFVRLERELAFHEAPASLRRDARRARRDEVRHTAMTLRLARRFGGSANLPEAPAETEARSLFEIARENAVEGCVRETYGAVMGLLEANVSSDADVRDASAKIAEDECRHAELAMDVARWVTPRLDASERAAISRAVEETIADLRARGDLHVVDLLAASVWGPMLQA